MENAILPCPFTQAPNLRMQSIAHAFHPPHGFCGRAGALITRKNGVESVFLATESILEQWLCPFENVTQTALWPSLSEKDVPFIRLRNKEGEELLLTQLLERLFMFYPKRPAKQGGEIIERRKAFWRYALVDALKSPSVRLLREYIEENKESTPVALNEWWCGPSPIHEMRHEGSFYPPRSSAKPLIDWLLTGIAHTVAQPVRNENDIPVLPVLYEDEDILVIDKPAKLASVPGIKEPVDAKTLLERDKGPLYVVHRLDTDTSGILLFARTKSALATLSETFRTGGVMKCYRVRLAGIPREESGIINLALFPNPTDTPRQCVLPKEAGGKPSETLYEVTDIVRTAHGPGALVSLYPKTGRTHQLRVHCAHAMGLNTPIDGDPFYGIGALANQVKDKRLCLHAAELTLEHPTKSKLLHFECPESF